MIELFYLNDAMQRMAAVQNQTKGQGPNPVSCMTGEDMIIGFSTHSPRQAREAVSMGADYIGVGPIFRTFTKKDVCEPVGLEYLDYAVRNCPIPFVAIGGIKEDNIAQVAGRGARLICAVTEILEADNIREKIFSLREKMELAAANKNVPHKSK